MAPPRSRAGYGNASAYAYGHGGPGSAAASQFSLANTRESYRDLLIFEERLKQNSARLASQRKKYEAFLLSLVASIALLAYKVVLAPSPYTLVQFTTSGLLLIGIVTLVLFFATGVYSEKIAYAYKFVPQANRALRYFNIYLNTKQPPRSWSMNPFRLFRGPPPRPSSAGSANTYASPVRGSTSSASLSSRGGRHAGLQSSVRSRTPASSGRSIPLAPIPPANNPRGELIFSSKVSQPYREGYERYRSDWEKRRKPSPSELTWGAYLKSFVGKKPHCPARVTASHARSEKVSGGAYAASPSDQSDSSIGPGFPAVAATSRGRDTRARPLLRTGSSSSLSSGMSMSPPGSRRSSPLRNPADLPSSAQSSPASTRSPTPELIREEDEEYLDEDERHHASRLASGSETSLATSPGSIPASPVTRKVSLRARADSFNEILEELREGP